MFDGDEEVDSSAADAASDSGSKGKGDDGKPEDGDENKPVPYKRFSKVYKEAKQGKLLADELKAMGIAPSELGNVRGLIEDYQRVTQELAGYKKNASGNPDTSDLDAEEKKELAKTQRLRKELLKIMPELAHVFKFMEKQANSNPDEAADTAKAGIVASGAREHLTGLLEDNGILDDDMDEDEKKEAIEEWEAKLAKRIGKDQEDTAKFRDGNKKVITKHFKEVYDTFQKRYGKPKPKGANIQNLAPRIRPGSTGQPAKPKAGEPAKTVRQAAQEMAAEMKANQE